MSFRYFNTRREHSNVTVILGHESPGKFFLRVYEWPGPGFQSWCKFSGEEFLIANLTVGSVAEQDMQTLRAALADARVEIPDAMFTELREDVKQGRHHYFVQHMADGNTRTLRAAHLDTSDAMEGWQTLQQVFDTSVDFAFERATDDMDEDCGLPLSQRGSNSVVHRWLPRGRDVTPWRCIFPHDPRKLLWLNRPFSWGGPVAAIAFAEVGVNLFNLRIPSIIEFVLDAAQEIRFAYRDPRIGQWRNFNSREQFLNAYFEAFARQKGVLFVPR